MGSIHKDRERLKSLVERLPESGLSQHNVDVVLEFKNFLEAEDASTSHVLRHVYAFYPLSSLDDLPADI